MYHVHVIQKTQHYDGFIVRENAKIQLHGHTACIQCAIRYLLLGAATSRDAKYA
jgi:hypothetical protein